MALKDDFEKASKDVMALSQRPDNDTLLELYGLYKQATEGDATGKRPGMLDIKGRKKFDSWAAKSGMASEPAMKSYVTLVTSLKK